MNKQETIQLLDNKIDTMLEWVSVQPDVDFAIQKVAGKWSIGEHLEHLRKTTRAVNKGMKLPKLFLRYKFGVNNRTERTYEETKMKYKTVLKDTGAKSPKEFTSDNVASSDKTRIMKWLREEKETMKTIVNKHSEKQLSKYVIPHPLIGKMTFREFAAWTGVHTDHHFELMQRDNE